MDLQERANATLARASARDDQIITPINATSPMDDIDTLRLSSSVIDEADARGQVPRGQIPTVRQPADSITESTSGTLT